MFIDLIINSISSLIISVCLGYILIPFLRKLKFGQYIREEGPESHKAKSGIPTMGGIIFIIAIFIPMITFMRPALNPISITAYSLLLFGAIGFTDDIIKIKRKNNLGLRAYQKMILLILFSIGAAFAGKYFAGTAILIPFTKLTVNLGFWYIPFMVLFFIATTNSVNLTDGLDGLASFVTIFVLLFLGLLAFYLKNSAMVVLSFVSACALLGFLKFNLFPAKVFMGDTGSLALGGLISCIAMFLKAPLVILLFGIIYVIEALSVIIQVISFKTTGKRIFKMSPIHHHFELSGMHETKVVFLFSIITIIFSVLGFYSFKGFF